MKNVNEKVGREMIVGTYAPPFDFDSDPAEIQRILDAINDSGATCLLFGRGGGRQEKFMVKDRDQLPNVKTFLPLGATIDSEAGTFRRPPAWVTEYGLEWLYRLVKEPKQRWRRYVLHQPPVFLYLLPQRLGLYPNLFRQK